MSNVTVWHCGGCGVVHMSVGKMVLNFTRDEFANFTEAVVDINYSGWRVAGDSIIDLGRTRRRNLRKRGGPLMRKA